MPSAPSAEEGECSPTDAAASTTVEKGGGGGDAAEAMAAQVGLPANGIARSLYNL